MGPLQEVDGEPNMTSVWSALMAGWESLLTEEPGRDSEIARVLFDLAANGEMPAPEAECDMLTLWDGRDLARDGIYGDRYEQRERLRTFLRRWASERCRTTDCS